MAVLERVEAPQRTLPPVVEDSPRRHSSIRWIGFGILFVLYATLTFAVLLPSPVLHLDRTLFGLDLYDRAPHFWPAINTYVMLGQRAPVTFAALPWILW